VGRDPVVLRADPSGTVPSRLVAVRVLVAVGVLVAPGVLVGGDALVAGVVLAAPGDAARPHRSQ